MCVAAAYEALLEMSQTELSFFTLLAKTVIFSLSPLRSYYLLFLLLFLFIVLFLYQCFIFLSVFCFLFIISISVLFFYQSSIFLFIISIRSVISVLFVCYQCSICMFYHFSIVVVVHPDRVFFLIFICVLCNTLIHAFVSFIHCSLLRFQVLFNRFLPLRVCLYVFKCCLTFLPLCVC